MKFKYLLPVIAFIAVSQSSFAQYAKDAVRYSTFQTGSTSRIKAIGNASTAIGGDLTSISGNPAGIGYFTRSEVSFTPEFDGSTNKSVYLDQAGSATKSNVNLSNIAYVYYSRLSTPRGQDKTKGWLSINLGASYNRTNNYDERIQYGAKNNNNSVNDYYASLANFSGVDDGLQSWANDQQLISAYGTSSHYTYAANSFPGVQQSNVIDRNGGQSALDFAIGANYSNKLYVGFGLGITNLQYKYTNNFTETGSVTITENSLPVTRGFNSTYSRFQNTKGDGVNARFGIIYKLLESVRVGVNITTPTYISVEDSYNEGLTNSLSNGKNYSNGPVEYPLSYTMTTPFKAAAGLAIFLGPYGFITGDVEYIDYSTTHMNSNDEYTNDYDNGIIKSTYKSAVNAHAGAEIKIGGVALRGGLGIQGSPLKTGGVDTKTVTGGLGYRLGSYYIDATYVHLTNSQSIMPYDIGVGTPVANINGTNNNIFLTVGYRY